jgi:hypothetical protein
MAADIVKPLRNIQLRLGPYATPQFRIGDVITDELRGDVTIVGLSDGLIPWPIGRTNKSRGQKSLILFGDLARAVKDESLSAVDSGSV